MLKVLSYKGTSITFIENPLSIIFIENLLSIIFIENPPSVLSQNTRGLHAKGKCCSQKMKKTKRRITNHSNRK